MAQGSARDRPSVSERIVARMWRCGDECDCWQPMVLRITPHPSIERANNLHILWEGTFRSEPLTEELEDMKRELREAAAEFNAVLEE